MNALLHDEVGRVLANLDETGMADSTIIAFTSDHGDVLGDRGLITKHTTLYDGCTHLPFLMSMPCVVAG